MALPAKTAAPERDRRPEEPGFRFRNRAAYRRRTHSRRCCPWSWRRACRSGNRPGSTSGPFLEVHQVRLQQQAGSHGIGGADAISLVVGAVTAIRVRITLGFHVAGGDRDRAGLIAEARVPDALVVVDGADGRDLEIAGIDVAAAERE